LKGNVVNEAQLQGEYSCHVYYEDTDFTGYVYHANYLKFMERAREHLFGIDSIKASFEDGHHFVVANLDITYKHPAKHADKLTVVSKAHLTRSPLFYVDQEVYRVDADGGRTLLTEARVKVVSVGQAGAPKRISEHFLSSLKNK